MELASYGFVVAAVEHRWVWVTFVELKYHLEQVTNLFNPNWFALLPTEQTDFPYLHFGMEFVTVICGQIETELSE